MGQTKEGKREMTAVLQRIQMELKAPKNQYNSFGKYKYRSQEDILEAVKPILAKYGVALTLSDEVVQVGERIYIKATASLFAGDDSIKVTAYAREPADKKGMDEAQITGTASSYARKYALNGLFAIDDTEDSDAQDKATADKPTPIHIHIDKVTPDEISAPKIMPLCSKNIKVETMAEAKAMKISLEKVAAYLKKKPEEVTEEERESCIARKKKELEAKK